MAKMTADWYRQQAREKITALQTGGRAIVDVHADADVSVGSNHGGWVSAWIWIQDPEETSGQEESKKPDGA